MSHEVIIDIMKSGAIVMHAQNGGVIAGITFSSAEDARSTAKALLMAAAQFVYFQFIDQGFMLSKYAEITNTPEFKTMLSAYGMKPDDMKLAMDNLASLRPIDIALQFLTTNIILGFMISLPIAAMMKSRYRKRF